MFTKLRAMDDDLSSAALLPPVVSLYVLCDLWPYNTCVYIYIYVYVYICICICIYVYVCVYIYIYINIHIYDMVTRRGDTRSDV